MLDLSDTEDSVLERLELPLLVIALSMAREARQKNRGYVECAKLLEGDGSWVAEKTFEVDLKHTDKATLKEHFNRLHNILQLSQTALMQHIEALTSPESAGDEGKVIEDEIYITEDGAFNEWVGLRHSLLPEVLRRHLFLDAKWPDSCPVRSTATDGKITIERIESAGDGQ